jgi:hypothetical protein
MAPLAVDLSVTPTRVTAEDTLDIEGAVHNRGPETVDPQVAASRLLVDGEPADVWGMAIANGLGDEREAGLPPGERVAFRRELPAGSVVPGPGRHRLVLVVRGTRSGPVVVERI